HLGQPGCSEIAQGAPELEDLGCTEPIDDLESAFVGLHHTGLSEHLKVGRGVGKAEPGLLRQLVDRALALAKQVEQLQTVRARQSLADGRELGVETILERAMTHLVSSTILMNY